MCRRAHISRASALEVNDASRDREAKFRCGRRTQESSSMRVERVTGVGFGTLSGTDQIVMARG